MNDNDLKTLKEMWQDPETMASPLLLSLIDLTDSRILTALPETLRSYIEPLLDIEVSDLVMTKVLALVTAITTDLFSESIESFHHICDALSGSPVNLTEWEPLSPTELGWGIVETSLHYDEAITFSPDVLRYMGVTLHTAGLVSGFGPMLDADFSGQELPTSLETWDDVSAKKAEESRIATLDALTEHLQRLMIQVMRVPLQDEQARKGRDTFLETIYPRLSQQIKQGKQLAFRDHQ